ncbi:hemagglutinin repeat-containing protein [Pandoraea pneumonica]|uniref:two-partner secretion domain-containing protein n=1 Tax=Pandoraea pneumonica TaxID=2508299 RepID=UPI001FE6A91B|nr:hemagglutinin repeat-containing protein [Pandoraea pneumonica]
MFSALGLTAAAFCQSATAQIVPAAGPHAPGVGVTPNGLPLVNITAPTAAGVSHNQYQQFDVPTQGAILNNAATIVQTQTGGLIPGNPNLTGDPARLILNQVTSTLPSNLAGYLEVAGGRAEVIVSNPNGITCNGCGFINTSRGVLTTGLPVFGGSGSLEAFRVTDGTVNVTGNGFNAGNLSHAALLARAVEVNAAVHAQQLDVVTGRNEVDASTFDVRSTEASSGVAPAFALDVSRLGGMYAGKIRLIGTEAGVGVNVDGDVSANGGTLTLSSEGQLRVSGKLHAGGALHVKTADSIHVSGDVLATDALHLQTARDLISTGQFHSGADVTLSVSGTWQHDGVASAARHFQGNANSVTSTGTIAAGSAPDGTAGQPADITLTVAGSLQAAGTHTATNSIRFTANAINLSGAKTTTPQNLLIHALSGSLSMVGATTRVGSTATLTSQGELSHDSASLATQHLSIDAAGLTNRGGELSQWGTSVTNITLRGALDNRDGRIAVNGSDLLLSSASLDNTAGKIDHAGTGATRLITGRIDNTDGSLATNGALHLSADSWRNDRGEVSAKQALYLLTHGLVSNQAGLIQSGGLFSLEAGALKNDGGRLLALGDATMRISVVGELANRSLNREWGELANEAANSIQGEIAGKGDVIVSAGDAINSGRWASEGTFRFEATGNLLNTGGQILARERVALAVRELLDNTGGRVHTEGQLDASANTLRNVGGQVHAGSLAIVAARLDNTSGEIEQSQPSESPKQRSDTSPQLKIGEALINHDGTIRLAAHDALIDTQTFDNAGGTVAHAGDGHLVVHATSLDNRSGQIGTNGDLQLAAESLENDRGRLTALHSLTADTTSFIDNTSGTIAGQAVTLHAQTVLQNARGTIESADTLDIRAQQLNNDGGALRNSGQGRTVIVATDGITNRQGAEIASNGAVTLSTGTLDNTEGTLRSGQSLTLETAAHLINERGELRANGALDAAIGGAFTNRSGRTAAHDALRLAVTDGIENSEGRIEAAAESAQLSLSSATLNNEGGTIVNAGTRALDIAVLGHVLNQPSRAPNTSPISEASEASGQANSKARGGIIADNGVVNLSSRSLENLEGARIESSHSLTLTTGGDFSNRQGHVQTNGALSLNVQGDIDNGAGEIHAGGALLVHGRNIANRQGSIRANDALTLTTSGELDNTDGEIHAGGGLQASSRSVRNRQGKILTIGALLLSARDEVDNSTGDIHSSGAMRVSGDTIVNAQGRVRTNDALSLTTQGAIDNTAGEIRSTGSANLSAENFVNQQGLLRTNDALTLAARRDVDNSGGEIHSTGAVRVSAENLMNRQGRVLSNRAATLGVDRDLDNTDGEIHAAGALDGRVDGALTNVRGSIEVASNTALRADYDPASSEPSKTTNDTDGGDTPNAPNETITLRAATLDNTDGRIVNATLGQTTLHADEIRNDASLPPSTSRPTGFIGGNGNVEIQSLVLRNGSGAGIHSGQDLALTIRDRFESAGSLFSGRDLHLTGYDGKGVQAFDNLGQLQARQDVRLTAALLNHRGGEIAVNRDLHLAADQLLGVGQLRAGNTLNITLPGDFILGPSHDWRSNGDLNLTISGLLTVTGELAAVRKLTVNAARLLNQGGGRIKGRTVFANATDRIDNASRIDGDDVQLRAPVFHNTGAVIGERIRFDGTHLTNTGAAAVMAATQQLDIFAQGQVLNENGATLYSLGGLRIGASDARDGAGFLAQQATGLTNRSATIEAGGDIDIAVKTFVNERGQINIERGIDEGTTTAVRHVWIAGYVTLPDDTSLARCAAATGAPCQELPTRHWSHSLRIDDGPTMIDEPIYEVNDRGQPTDRIKETKKVPNPGNIPFTQWRWTQEASAAHSAEKLYAVRDPIAVTLPKGHLTALDTDNKTFSLAKPIIEVYKDSVYSVDYATRNITQRAVQHFESIQDDGNGNWIVRFWPDYDPSQHIRPTVVDEARQPITGAPDEGARIFRFGHGIQDGRDTNEYRRQITTRSTVDRIVSADAPGVIASQRSIRLNVEAASALNYASVISAGGNLDVRGNGGEITNRSVGLERIEQTSQTSDLYWHEKRGNKNRWFTSVNLGTSERKSVVGGLDAVISSNQSTRIHGRDIVIDTVSGDGSLIDARWVDAQVSARVPDVPGTLDVPDVQRPENPQRPQVTIDADDTLASTVSTAAQSTIDAPQPAQVSTVVSGALQTLDPVSGGIPDLTLPSSGLFSIVTAPSQPYLVVTDARFTDYGKFVSSNYMLDLLNVDPAGIERRIGDGFYEAKLVRDQILRLTGRARLTAYDSNEAAAADTEYRSLLAQGARAGRDLLLRVGIRLTEAQMQALTDDIVWLVKQDVTAPDGSTQTVLVPTLYLAHGKRVSLQPGGALVTGRDMVVEASQTVSNRGQIVGDASTKIRAVDIENHGVIGGIAPGGIKGAGGVSKAGRDGAANLGSAARDGAAIVGSVESVAPVNIDRVSVGNVEVIASRDIANIGGEILGNQVRVEAGRDVVVTSQTRTVDWMGVGGSGKTTAVDAIGRIGTLDTLNVTAGRDLNVTGAQIQSSGDTELRAGRDVSIGSIAVDRSFGDGRTGDNRSATQVTEHAASVVDVGGNTSVVAGRDAVTKGAQVNTGGNVVIAAGRDVEVAAVTDKLDFTGRSRNDGHAATADTHTESVQGSDIRAGGAIGIAAGQIEAVQRVLEERGVRAYVSEEGSRKGDAKVLGSYVSAGDSGVRSGNQDAGAKGAVQIVASGDVTVGGVTAQHDDVRWSRDTKSGLLSKTTEERYREVHGTQTTGSTVSGDTVKIASGRDVSIIGSNVVADGNATVAAQGNVAITSAEDRQQSLSVSETKTSGVFGSGTSITIGKRSEKETKRRESTSQTGSVLGSVTGDVTVRAGDEYRQEGSAVIAPAGNIDISAKRAAITESVERDATERETEVRQSGVTIAISSPLLAAAETVGQMGKAVSKVDDGRMKALGVAAGGLAVKNAADTVKNLKDAANVSVSITVGGSMQKSRETQESTTSIGSRVSAGGNVSVSAEGDGKASSLLVRGSDIKAGQDATLKADGDISVLASADTFEQHRKSSGISGGIGVGVSVGSNGMSIGVTANASASRGKADGKDVTNNYSHITADGKTTVASGGDTTVKGGVIAGERVVVDVGGDLSLESLQDTSVYESKDQSISASGTVGFGGASGSVNVSHQKISSDFASVTEQAGIKAGDGGFDVSVSGNTDLVGAVIASTDKAAESNRNRLKTGSLTERDIENHAEYDAFGVSLGGGVSTGGGDSAKVGTDQKGHAETGAKAIPGSELPKTGPVSVAPPTAVAASGNATSVTRSGISAGVIEITDEASQLAKTGKTTEETIASVNRDVSTDKDGTNALTNKFDKEQIETSFEIMQALQREVGTFVNNRAKKADEIEAQLKNTTDPVQRAALSEQLADAKKWGPGGDYRLIVSAVTAGIGGNVTGAAGEMASRATVTYLQGLAAKEIKTLGENLDPASKATLHAIAGCAGGAASGGSCDAGAMGAAAGSLLGSLLATADKPGQPLSQSEREARVNLITSIVAGVTAGVGRDVATASTGAKTEAENNTLGITVLPPPPQTGTPSGQTSGNRGKSAPDELDPNGRGTGSAKSATARLAYALREALADAACKVSPLACASRHVAEQASERVGSDASENPTITATPNNGPSGATITTTPDSGEKGPTLTATPDKGERSATITATPDQDSKGPTITATPNDGPVVFDPMLKTPEDISPSQEADEKRTARPKRFRKKTIEDAWSDAPVGSNSSTKACPTCGKDVEVAPGNGPRDWDIDHQPPWSQRDHSEKTRKEILDNFNEGTRLECPGCNRSRGAKPAEK